MNTLADQVAAAVMRIALDSVAIAAALLWCSTAFDATEIASLALIIPSLIAVEVVVWRSMRTLKARDKSGRARPFALAVTVLASIALLHGAATLVRAAYPPELRVARWHEGSVEHELVTERRPWESSGEQRERLVDAFLSEVQQEP